jgi:hypothetical protein
MVELLLRIGARGRRLEVRGEAPERPRREPLAGAGLSYTSLEEHIVAII